MTAFKNIVVLLVLSLFLAVSFCQIPQGGPHGPQGGPHQNQGRIRRQVPQNVNPQNWTTCNFTAASKVSCADCNTRVICKPFGGLLKPCNNPNRPYCNFGICSAVPSPACI